MKNGNKKKKRLVPFVEKIVLLIREIIYLIIVVHKVILSVGNIRNYKYIFRLKMRKKSMNGSRI